MDLRDMHYLIALDKHKNIGKAADEVHVSQPALSKFLQQQNRLYGEKLFVKYGHRLKTTEFGAFLLKYAEQFVALEEELNHEIENWQTRGRPFKIAIPGGTGRYVMSIVYPLFKEKYPDVELIYNEIHSITACEKVMSGEIDMAICGKPTDDKELSWKNLYCEPMVLAVSKEHPIVKTAEKKNGFPHPWIDLNNMENDTFYLLEKTKWPRIATELIFKQVGFRPKKSCVVADIQTAAKFASNGLGATILIDKYHTFMADQDRLAVLSCGIEPIYHQSTIVWKKNRVLPSYCEELIQEILAVFQEIEKMSSY